MYINAENNNTKKKTMTGYLQQHGQLLRAHKKTENNKFRKFPLPLPLYKLTEIVVSGFGLSTLVQQMHL